ncbi:TIGR02594 family protein [Phreatobacter sp.]|uniref:TIGR02594 family protein n=1 Tax=Phreatobacter sp. TaxID=1966341 RepID=UPI003F7076A1
MTALPTKYAFLAREGAPRMLVEALKLHGVHERGNNPAILAWAKEVGLEKVYRHTSIAWCGLFAAIVAKRAGWDVVKDPLWARNWAKFGKVAKPAMLGDILVFTRGTGGHVGVYVGEDAGYFHVLGGNQSDQVNVTRIAKSRLLAARQPAWRIAAPANRRVIRMAASGPVSTNEA